MNDHNDNDQIMAVFAKFATVIVIIALLWAMISQLVMK